MSVCRVWVRVCVCVCVCVCVSVSVCVCALQNASSCSAVRRGETQVYILAGFIETHNPQTCQQHNAYYNYTYTVNPYTQIQGRIRQSPPKPESLFLPAFLTIHKREKRHVKLSFCVDDTCSETMTLWWQRFQITGLSSPCSRPLSPPHPLPFPPSAPDPSADGLGHRFKACRPSPSHVECFLSLSTLSLKWFSCCPSLSRAMLGFHGGRVTLLSPTLSREPESTPPREWPAVHFARVFWFGSGFDATGVEAGAVDLCLFGLFFETVAVQRARSAFSCAKKRKLRALPLKSSGRLALLRFSRMGFFSEILLYSVFPSAIRNHLIQLNLHYERHGC